MKFYGHDYAPKFRLIFLVLGLDLSDNMLAVAYEHKLTMEEKVQHLVSFRFLDATLAEFPENYFDCVYTRDAVMHIAEKELMYR